MKKRSICSIIVLVCFIVSSFGGAYAEGIVPYTPPAHPTPQNELENVVIPGDSTTAPLTVEQIENIRETKTDFSALSETEKEQFCAHYALNCAKMEELEQAGYGLSESVDLCLVLQFVQMTPAQFEQMVLNFESRELALSQAQAYAQFPYEYAITNWETDATSINFLVSGVFANQILKANAMAYLLSVDVAESALFDGNEADYGTDDLGYIASMFCTKRAYIDAYLTQNNMTPEDFLALVEETLGFVLEKTGDLPTTYDSSTDEEEEETPTAPYSYVKNGTEFINEMTGDVGFEETDVVLPGKNGLDLKIGVRYNSNDSSPIWTSADGYNMRESMTIDKKVSYSPLVNMAAGWSFTFSHVQVHKYYSTEMIHLETQDGKKYSKLTERPDASIVADLRPLEKSIEDIIFFTDTSYTDNGITSQYCAEYMDGRKEYFDGEGKLMKIENRFGDAIYFRYSDVIGTGGYSAGHTYNIYGTVTITDTLNQVTTISYGEEYTNGYTYKDILVTLPDNTTLTYTMRKAEIYDPNEDLDDGDDPTLLLTTWLLVEKVGRENYTTDFWYKEDDWSTICTTPGRYVCHKYYPLEEITFPTGMKTYYTYEKALGSVFGVNPYDFQFIGGLYGDASWERYHIKEREDDIDDVQVNNQYIGSGRNANRVTYTYEGGDFSLSKDTPLGYVKVISTNQDGLSTEKTFTGYKITGSGSGQQEVQTVDPQYRLKTSEYVYYMDGETEVPVSRIDYANYYRRTLPQTVTKKVYNPQNAEEYMQTVEKYEYDEYGNCIKYWNPRANGDTTNTTHLTTNTYDDTYHYLTQTTYPIDDTTTGSMVYTPSNDHKNILEEKGYRGSTLTSWVSYSYGANAAYPTTKTAHRSEWTGDSVTTTYEYLNNTFPVKETTNGKVTQYAYDNYGNVISVTDPKNQTTTFTYDQRNRKTRETYPDLNYTSWVYGGIEASGKVVTERTPNGTETEYVYGSVGLLKGVYNKTLDTVDATYTYDGMNRLIREDYSNGQFATYAYDVLGRVIAETKGKDTTTTYTKTYTYQDYYDQNTSKVLIVEGTGANQVKLAQYYDKFGNLVREDPGDTGTLVGSRMYEYDYVGDQIRELYRTEENGEDLIRMEVEVYGNSVYVTNATGYVPYTEYNLLGQVTSEGDESTSVGYAYNASGLLMEATSQLYNPATDTSGDSTTEYFYDDNGNLIQTKIKTSKPGATATYRSSYTEYDNRNRPIKVWDDGGYIGEDLAKTIYTYDAMGNVVTMEVGHAEYLYNDEYGGIVKPGHITTYTYNARNQLISITDPMNKTESYTYDAMGNTLTKTDRNGNVTSYTYTGGNQVSGKYLGSNAGDTETMYTYYDNGLLKDIIYYDVPGEPVRQTTTYQYNNKGEMTGEVRTGYGAYTKTYAYDQFGNEARFQLRTGTSSANAYDVGYTYNANNQLLTVKDNLTNQTVASYTYNYLDLLSSKTLANGVTTTYTYGDQHKLLSVENKKDGVTLSSYAYEYYLDGNQSKVTDHTGRVQAFTYDGGGRVTNETDSVYGNTNYQYDRFGNRDMMVKTGAVAIEEIYCYDANNRLEWIERIEDEEDFSYESYFYDNNGNLVLQLRETQAQYMSRTQPDVEVMSQVDPVEEALMEELQTEELQTEDEQTEELQTEVMPEEDVQTEETLMKETQEEVVQAEVAQAGPTQVEETLEEVIQEDLQLEAPSGEEMLLDMALEDTLTAEVMDTYADSTENSTRITYTYDGENRLLTVDTDDGLDVDYTYDATGARMWKWVNGYDNYQYWDGQNIVYEDNKSYFHGYEPLAQKTGSTFNQYYLQNGHGDVTQVTNTLGVAMQTTDYDAFGNLQTTPTVQSPFGYAGEYTDAETGFVYLRNRYYDPSIGRFITEDPIRDGINWYAYCENDPVNRIDPTGLDSWVFYDGEAFGEQAKNEAENLRDQYGTEVHLVDIWSLTGFLSNWNKMIESDGAIDGVSLLFHGSPFTIYLGNADGQVGQLTSSTQDVTPNGSSGYYVGDLAKASMRSLNVMSCNGGHLDYIYSNDSYQNEGFNHNIVVEFLVTHDIDIAYGMDGSLAYTKLGDNYYPRLALDQLDYYEWTPSREYLGKRTPIGKVAYWLNDSGDVGYWTVWARY